MEQPFKEGTRPLAGLTMGLLGCGDIGLQIVKAAKVMGLKTAAFKRDISVPGANTQARCITSCALINTNHETPPKTWYRRGVLALVWLYTVEGVDMLSSDVQAVLKASDFVVNTLPSTPATRGLLCGDALAICGQFVHRRIYCLRAQLGIYIVIKAGRLSA